MKTRYTPSSLCDLFRQMNEAQAREFIKNNAHEISTYTIPCTDVLFWLQSSKTYNTVANALFELCTIAMPRDIREVGRIVSSLGRQAGEKFSEDHRAILATMENKAAILKNLDAFQSWGGVKLLTLLNIHIHPHLPPDELITFVVKTVERSAHAYSFIGDRYEPSHWATKQQMDKYNADLGAALAAYLQPFLLNEGNFNHCLTLLEKLDHWTGTDYGDPYDPVKFQFVLAMQSAIADSNKLTSVSRKFKSAKFREAVISRQMKYWEDWEKEKAATEINKTPPIARNAPPENANVLWNRGIADIAFYATSGGFLMLALHYLINYINDSEMTVSNILVDITLGTATGITIACSDKIDFREKSKEENKTSLTTTKSDTKPSSSPTHFKRRSELLALKERHESSADLRQRMH